MMFDEETLEALTYRRSKDWAKLMQSYKDNDLDETKAVELSIDDFDQLFKDDDEDDDRDSAAAAEAIEEVVVEDVSNATMMVASNTNRAELTLMLCGSEHNKQQQNEMEELLNQTLPVFEQHTRKWKEAGLYRILNTFDAQKIEEHVGDWMRRNNSAYGGSSPQQSPVRPSATGSKCRTARTMYSDSDSASEVESLHSVDTARYIRASRKHKLGHPLRPLSTTIKMYRTMPRKRDELRAKYHCSSGGSKYDEEQEHRLHMQSLRLRRQQQQQMDEPHRRRAELVSFRQSPRHYKCHASFAGTTHLVRRKHLRKRRSNSTVFNSVSSSDEEYSRYSSPCPCISCSSRASCRRHLCSCREHSSRRTYVSATSQTFHCARSVRSVHHIERSQCQRRLQSSYEEDLRPRLMENDCSCCNSDRLCSEVVHLVNSSTEEWVVENCNSPVQVPGPKKRRASHIQVGVQKVPKRRTPSVAFSRETSEDEQRRKPKAKPRQVKSSDSSDDEIFKQLELKKIQSIKAVHTDSLPQIAEEKVPTVSKSRLASENEQKMRPRTKVRQLKSSDNSEEEAFKKQKPEKNQSIKAVHTASLPQIAEEKVVSVSESRGTSENERKIRPRTKVRQLKSSDNSEEETFKKLIPEKSQSIKAIHTALLPQIAEEINPSSDSETSRGTSENHQKVGPKAKERQLNSSDTSKDEIFNKLKSEKSQSIQAVNTASLPQKAGENAQQNITIISLESSSDGPSKLINPKDIPPRIKEDTSLTKSAGEKAAKSIKKPQRQTTKSVKLSRLQVIDSESDDPKSRKAKLVKKKKSPKRKVNKKEHLIDKDLERALANSKKTYEEEKRIRVNATESPTISTQVAEQTVCFNNASVACNSTALVNDTLAAGRALNSKGGVKKAVAVSTSISAISAKTPSQTPKESPPKLASDDADCTIVTSTTGLEEVAKSTQKPAKPQPKVTKQGILLHSPALQQGSKVSSLGFTLTEQSLSDVIGLDKARKFLKYYLGNRSFDSRYSVYYRPPQSTPNKSSSGQESCSSSDDDVFDRMERYGSVHAVLEEPTTTTDSPM